MRFWIGSRSEFRYIGGQPRIFPCGKILILQNIIKTLAPYAINYGQPGPELALLYHASTFGGLLTGDFVSNACKMPRSRSPSEALPAGFDLGRGVGGRDLEVFFGGSASIVMMLAVDNEAVLILRRMGAGIVVLALLWREDLILCLRLLHSVILRTIRDCNTESSNHPSSKH